MSTHYEGYFKAVAAVREMNEAELLEQIDCLFGRADLPDNYTLEQLRAIALAQVDEDWTDTSSEEFQKSLYLKGRWIKRQNKS